MSLDGVDPAAPEPSVAVGRTRRMAALLMGGALFSKVLGFAREILMAHILGASMMADGYRGAVTAVLLPLAFLQNESVPAILIPMHHAAQARGQAPRMLAALGAAVTIMSMTMMFAVQGLGTLWVHAVVGGFSAEGQSLTLQFVRIMSLAMPASALVNCLASAEIASGQTGLTNLRASMLNVAMIAGLLLLPVTGQLTVLAWAFMLSFNVLAAWAILSLWRRGMLDPAGLRPSLIWANACEFLHRLRPLLALPVAEQIHVWIERMLASRLVTGALASLDYARTLSDTGPLLISQPVGLAVMSGIRSPDRQKQFEAVARPILAVMLPASAFVFVFAPEIIRLVFFRGAFGENGVLLTGHALRGISVGLWASTLGWVLLRRLNADGRNLLATSIVICAYAANALVNLTTIGLHPADGSGVLILGLGEAARGIVLLAGTLLVVEGRGALARLVAVALCPAALMLATGSLIEVEVAAPFVRLLYGGLAGVACVLVGLGLLLPTVRKSGFGRLRRCFPARGQT